uniref:Uncharacterized protein n=1 Tax=Kwoniella pini CBS 10737 TaxID=1296096 RepID=A0A1B9I1W1_9TREE|nr:uncharacterized protein I206_04043 [Kwoniella pini CBS 10737]OCF49522.1 hypothetical protein I206_04043 [Kwoniella pini CBS 10737]
MWNVDILCQVPSRPHQAPFRPKIQFEMCIQIPDPRLLASDYDNLTAHIEEFTRILTSINHAIIPHNSSEDLHLLEKTYGEESCRLNERWESFRRRGWSNLSDVDTLSTAKEKYDAAWKSYLESGKGWKDNYMQTLKECIDRTHVAALVIEQLRETGNTYLTELVRRVSSDCLESYEELRVYNGGTEHELSSIVIPPFERTHPKFDEKYREWIRIRPEVVAIRNFAQSLAKSRGQSSNQGSSSLSEN